MAACNREGSRLRLQFPIPPAPKVLPFRLCSNLNGPGSRRPSVATRSPVLGPTVSCKPTGCPRVPLAITSSTGLVSVPSPIPSLAHTFGACTLEEAGGSKKKKRAQLLAALRAHVAQASAPSGRDWASRREAGPAPPRPPAASRRYKLSLQPPLVLSAPPRSTDSRIFPCSARYNPAKPGGGEPREARARLRRGPGALAEPGWAARPWSRSGVPGRTSALQGREDGRARARGGNGGLGGGEDSGRTAAAARPRALMLAFLCLQPRPRDTMVKVGVNG